MLTNLNFAEFICVKKDQVVPDTKCEITDKR